MPEDARDELDNWSEGIIANFNSDETIHTFACDFTSNFFNNRLHDDISPEEYVDLVTEFVRLASTKNADHDAQNLKQELWETEKFPVVDWRWYIPRYPQGKACLRVASGN
jgi:hypothetical protein